MKQRRKRYVSMILALLALGVFVVMHSILSATHAGEGQPAQSGATPPDEKMTPEGGACCKAGDMTPPTELVKRVPKGQLHSPYPDYAKLAKEEELVKQFRHGRRGDLPGADSRRLALGKYRRRVV